MKALTEKLGFFVLDTRSTSMEREADSKSAVRKECGGSTPSACA